MSNEEFNDILIKIKTQIKLTNEEVYNLFNYMLELQISAITLNNIRNIICENESILNAKIFKIEKYYKIVDEVIGDEYEQN